MNNQFKILMIGSALAFLILSAIQYYLIKNTYNYKISAFQKELKENVSEYSDKFTLSDSIQDIGKVKIYKYVDDYYSGRISKHAILDSIDLLKQSDSLNGILISDFHKKMGNDKLEYGWILTDFILLDTLTGLPDTLLSAEPSMDNYLYGNLSSLNDAIYLSTGTSSSNLDSKYGLIVSLKEYVSLEKWKEQVFRNMWSLIFLAVSILLSVIGLFIYTLRAWMKQKRITEIKNDFINNITHEFKTPLATLSIASKSLRHEKVLESRPMLDNTLNSIDRQNSRLQKLLDQVMSKSIGVSELKLSLKKVNAKKLLDEIIHDFRMSQEASHITINHDNKLQGEILVDRFYLTTAIFNVLDNAVKYSESKSNIDVSCTRVNNDLNLEISDNGIGISKKDIQTIFDKFYRVNTGDTHNVKGLGLGLFYTKNIIDAHQGKIKVESAENVGTKVIIHLQNIFI